MRYRAQLDWLNFFLADVRGGLGPYVGVFLLTQVHWDQATLGAVLTVSGLTGIALHAPIGALIDVTRFKRGLLIAGVVALTASALAIAWAPTLLVVLAADIVVGPARLRLLTARGGCLFRAGQSGPGGQKLRRCGVHEQMLSCIIVNPGPCGRPRGDASG